jgi:hypothetical protein
MDNNNIENSNSSNLDGGLDMTISNNNIIQNSKLKKTNIDKLIDKINDDSKYKNNIIYSTDTRADGSKYFKLINFNDRTNLIKSNNHNYELLIKSNNIINSFKLYIDLDHYKNNENKNFNDDNNLDIMINDFCIDINKYFNEKYNLNNELDVIILTASTDKKFSYHLIFNNIKFNTIIDMKYEIEQIYLKFNDHIFIKFKFLDISVYSKNRSFRLINNSKFGTNNTLQISKFHHKKIDKTLINNSFVCSEITHNINVLISNITTENKKKLNTKIKQHYDYNLDTTELSLYQIELSIFLKNNNYEKLFIILDNYKSLYFDNYSKWKYIITILKHLYNDYELVDRFSKKSELNYDSKHQNILEYDKIEPIIMTHELFNKYIYILCDYLKYSNIDIYNSFNLELKPFNINREYYKKYFNQKKFEQIEDFYDINIDYINSVKHFQYIKYNKNDLINIGDNYYLDNDIIINNIKNNDVLMIKSFMGSGKNESIYKYIKHSNPQSILILTTRIIYGINIKNEFFKKCDLNFDIYTDNTIKKNNSINSNYLICSIHSLTIVDIKNYDLLILDEIESINNVFNGEHGHINFLDNYNKYESLIQTSKKIIITDRDLNYTSIQMFEKIIKKTLIIDNVFYPYNHICKKYLSEVDMKNKMMDDIKNNKKLVIYHNEKSSIINFKYEINQLYPNKKIIIHYSKSEDNKQFKHKNINEIWDCDILIYNSCITVGVSYSKPHFDNLYCYAKSVNMRDLFQSLNRVRIIKSNELNIFISEKSTPYDENYNKIDITNNILFKNYQIEIMDDLLNLKNDTTYKKIIQIQQKFGGDIPLDNVLLKLYEPIPELLRQIRYRAISERKLNENSLLIFEYFLNKQNYKIEIITPEDINIKKNLETIAKPDITIDEFKKIEIEYDRLNKLYFYDENKINNFLTNEYSNNNSNLTSNEIDLIKQLIIFYKFFEYKNEYDDENRLMIFQNYYDNKYIYKNYYYFNNDRNIFIEYSKNQKIGHSIEFQKNKYDHNRLTKKFFEMIEITDILKKSILTLDKLNNIYNYIDSNIDIIKNIFNIKTENIKIKSNINHYILKQFLHNYGLKIKKKTFIVYLDKNILFHSINIKKIKNKKNINVITFLDEIEIVDNNNNILNNNNNNNNNILNNNIETDNIEIDNIETDNIETDNIEIDNINTNDDFDDSDYNYNDNKTNVSVNNINNSNDDINDIGDIGNFVNNIPLNTIIDELLNKQLITCDFLLDCIQQNYTNTNTNININNDDTNDNNGNFDNIDNITKNQLIRLYNTEIFFKNKKNKIKIKKNKKINF